MSSETRMTRPIICYEPRPEAAKVDLELAEKIKKSKVKKPGILEV